MQVISFSERNELLLIQIFNREFVAIAQRAAFRNEYMDPRIDYEHDIEFVQVFWRGAYETYIGFSGSHHVDGCIRIHFFY